MFEGIGAWLGNLYSAGTPQITGMNMDLGALMAGKPLSEAFNPGTISVKGRGLLYSPDGEQPGLLNIGQSLAGMAQQQQQQPLLAPPPQIGQIGRGQQTNPNVYNPYLQFMRRR